MRLALKILEANTTTIVVQAMFVGRNATSPVKRAVRPQLSTH
jgi:hypothetical protein